MASRDQSCKQPVLRRWPKSITLVKVMGVFFMVAFGVCLGLPSHAADDIPSGANHVENFSFETISPETGFAEGWSTRVDEGVMEFAVDTSVVRSGFYALRQTGVVPGERNRGPVFQRTVAPAGSYRFTAWYQTAGLTDPEAVRVRIRFFDSSNREIIGLSDDPQFKVLSSRVRHYLEGEKNLYVFGELSEGNWNHVELEFVTPMRTERILIELFLWRDVGSVWWDDISLVKLD